MHEAECFVQEVVARLRPARERAHPGESLQRELLGDLRVPGDERLVRDRLGEELEAEALGVLEAEAVLLPGRIDAGAGPTFAPEVENTLGPDPEGDLVERPRARGAARQVGFLG